VPRLAQTSSQPSTSVGLLTRRPRCAACRWAERSTGAASAGSR
jgi:hypothetical protein